MTPEGQSPYGNLRSKFGFKGESGLIPVALFSSAYFNTEVTADTLNFHYFLALLGKTGRSVSYGLTRIKQDFQNAAHFDLFKCELGFDKVQWTGNASACGTCSTADLHRSKPALSAALFSAAYRR